ncbi:unnamed protein product [Rodentolepis nana]|uniref:phosphatidate cytidylyltransferase n=1 Tax=Rodentolepis nana TaxID=102285 RepID=A0A0R3TT03_RODNA|nr:unnamed protein product [Rodentolepis nana]
MDERDTEVTHRRASVRGDEGEESSKSTKTASLASKSALTDQSSADEAPLSSDLELDPKAAVTLLEGSSHVPTCLESCVSGLSPRLTNCVVRLFASIIMIGGFLFLIYLGPLALVLLDFLAPLVVPHRFISFTLYCACIVAFVLNLKRKHYLKQFTLVSCHFVIQISLSSYSIMIGAVWSSLCQDQKEWSQ